MQLPKGEYLYPNRPDANVIRKNRTVLNRLTLEFWDSWIETCIKHDIDPEAEWKRQRNYLYDLFYNGRGYERKRPVKNDNRKNNGRKPRANQI